MIENTTFEALNRAVDQWVARENAWAGRVYRPGFGMYPSIQKGCIAGENGINNVISFVYP